MVRCSSRTERWRCSVSNGEEEISADTSKAGGDGEGFRPHELLEASLASCLNITVRMAAADRDIPLEGVRTNVSLQRSDDRTTFSYTLEFEGITETEADVLRRAVSSCPVQETLSKEIVCVNVSEGHERDT